MVTINGSPLLKKGFAKDGRVTLAEYVALFGPALAFLSWRVCTTRGGVSTHFTVRRPVLPVTCWPVLRSLVQASSHYYALYCWACKPLYIWSCTLLYCCSCPLLYGWSSTLKYCWSCTRLVCEFLYITASPVHSCTTGLVHCCTVYSLHCYIAVPVHC